MKRALDGYHVYPSRTHIYLYLYFFLFIYFHLRFQKCYFIQNYYERIKKYSEKYWISHGATGIKKELTKTFITTHWFMIVYMLPHLIWKNWEKKYHKFYIWSNGLVAVAKTTQFRNNLINIAKYLPPLHKSIMHDLVICFYNITKTPFRVTFPVNRVQAHTHNNGLFFTIWIGFQKFI